MLLVPRRLLACSVMVGWLLPALHSSGPVAPTATIHNWRSVRSHWQKIGEVLETAAETDAREGTRGACPPGMVEVSGRMKHAPAPEAIEELQKTTCAEWIDREFPERCARFDRDAWLALSARLESRPMHYCIDRFEAPGLLGAYPFIEVTWQEAVLECEAADKRLCTEDEWTFACEGEEAEPYPNGYVRDREACVIDRPLRDVDERALEVRESAEAIHEIDRLWQGEASGARPACRSSAGVYDLTGNVDEWTASARSSERPSVLKGGYWGPVRNRCRPSTRAHGETYSYYQQGFRCCREVP